MSDWFADNAPKAASGDWFAANAPQAKPKSWADKLGLPDEAIGAMPISARNAVDFAEGVASKAASTVFHGGDAIRRAIGMERVIDRPEVQQAMKTPDTLSGQVGGLAEQTAEYAIPGSAVGKIVKGASLPLRIAAQAATSGAVGAAQSGGDPLATGVAAGLGGAGELIGGALASKKAADALRASAEKQYGQAINATIKGNKWLSQNKVVPELLDRGVMASSLKSLKGKATSAVEGVGQAINDAWANLPAGSTAELDPILNSIGTSARDALTITAADGSQIPITPAAKHALGTLDALKQTLSDVAEVNPATGIKEVPVEKLRQLRQAWDEVAAQAKVYQGGNLADAATGKIHAMAADAARNELAKDYPDIAAMNKDFSFWKNVEQVVGDTILRKVGQSKPLGQQIAGAAGVAMGGASGGIHGAIIGKSALEFLTAATRSTAWRTVSAVQKNNLARYLANGNRSAAERLIGQISKSIVLEEAVPDASSKQN